MKTAKLINVKFRTTLGPQQSGIQYYDVITDPRRRTAANMEKAQSSG